MPHWISALFAPVANIFTARENRRLARQQAQGKLLQAQLDGSLKLELNKDEWENLQVKGMNESWKDEYVTVSVVSILNVIVVGGLASAFGYPEILTGIGTAIKALGETGVDIGFLLEAAVLAGLGLSIWKRF
jgi:hypothetical protein